MSDRPRISDRLRDKKARKAALKALNEAAARTDPAAEEEFMAYFESRHTSQRAAGTYIPPWMRYLQNDQGPWGFFIYRVACYGDLARWERYRAALEQLWVNSWRIFWEDQLEIGVPQSLLEMVKQRMQLTWVEEEELDGQGVDEVRRRFGILGDAMPSVHDEPRLGRDPWNLDLPIPYHLDRYACLCVDEDAVSSLIGPPGSEVAWPESVDGQLEQARGTYVLAVDAEYNPYDSDSLAEAVPYPGWLKVAAGVILTELCPRRTYINHRISLNVMHRESYGVLASIPGIWMG